MEDAERMLRDVREATLIYNEELKWGRGKREKLWGRMAGSVFRGDSGELRVGEFQGVSSLCVEDIKRNSDQERTF